jgi:hypothetical protein
MNFLSVLLLSMVVMLRAAPYDDKTTWVPMDEHGFFTIDEFSAE